MYLSNKLNLEFPTITLDLGVTCSDALTLDLGVTGSDAKLRLLNNIPFYVPEYTDLKTKWGNRANPWLLNNVY